MHIAFYIPDHHLPSKERRDEWMNGSTPQLLEAGKSACAQCWLYQTWAEIRNSCDVSIVTELPSSGNVITLSNFLGTRFRAKPRQFVAAIAADYLPHPSAQIQIVQNKEHATRLPGAVFMPLWPQPNLIPRHSARGMQLETAAFFGDPSNLTQELANPRFTDRLHAETGARLEIRGASRWHDYSDVDVVLAIRDFSRSRHLHKPATKLYNAWIAGVPLIGGSDSAYAAEAQDGTDYLMARSPDDCVRLVRQLRDDPSLRRRIEESGHKKTASRSRDAVRNEWKNLCNVTLPEQIRQWERRSLFGRRLFWSIQKSLLFVDRRLRS